MPILTPIQTDPHLNPRVLLSLYARDKQKSTRSKGTHLSGVIRSFLSTLDGKLNPAIGDLSPSEMVKLAAHFEKGFMWERLLELAWKLQEQDRRGVLPHDTEFELDGIFGTPDWVNVVESLIEEAKCTHKSMNKFLMDNIEYEMPEWFMQMMGYCKLTKFLKARLYVLALNGDYKLMRQPKVIGWEIQFTQQEVDLNWAKLVQHKREMGL